LARILVVEGFDFGQHGTESLTQKRTRNVLVRWVERYFMISNSTRQKLPLPIWEGGWGVRSHFAISFPSSLLQFLPKSPNDNFR
jgi:hypothetical protein